MSDVGTVWKPMLLGLAAALILPTSASCALSVNGIARPAADSFQYPAVEWSTDPEGQAEEFIAVVMRGDGRFQVGRDFPSGTYQSAGSRPGLACRWRLSSTVPDGRARILAFGGGPGPQQVTINSDDSEFESYFCQPWHRVT